MRFLFTRGRNNLPLLLCHARLQIIPVCVCVGVYVCFPPECVGYRCSAHLFLSLSWGWVCVASLTHTPLLLVQQSLMPWPRTHPPCEHHALPAASCWNDPRERGFQGTHLWMCAVKMPHLIRALVFLLCLLVTGECRKLRVRRWTGTVETQKHGA